MPSRAEHRKRLKELPCIVTGKTDHITLHHCHGGSIKEELLITSGGAQKTNDFLQVPLCFRLHLGDMNPEHIGIVTWEANIGMTQVEMLNRVSQLLGYDVIKYAQEAER